MICSRIFQLLWSIYDLFLISWAFYSSSSITLYLRHFNCYIFVNSILNKTVLCGPWFFKIYVHNVFIKFLVFLFVFSDFLHVI
jgi:hypothetical protein